MPTALKSRTGFEPDESIIIHQPIGLVQLGSSFNAEAPFRGCRLCGAVYQSELDLAQYKLYSLYDGFPKLPPGEHYNPHTLNQYNRLVADALARRIRWEELHMRRKHNNARDMLQLEHLHKNGIAFTPDAAHILTSYGIFPTGNKTEEIAHAMHTAPRAPVNDPES